MLNAGVGSRPKDWRSFFLVFGIFLFYSPFAISQTPGGSTDIGARLDSLEAGQRQILEDLRLLKNLLSAKQPVADQRPLENVVINTAGAASLGAADSIVTMIEFSDYQCPFCGSYAKETFPKLISEFVNTGRVRYVVRNFPLEQIHSLALKAAEAAECAGDQGRFWEFHGRLFNNQQALDSENLLGHAVSIGLDRSRFRECMDNSKFGAKVKADLEDGQKLGVNGTPSFFFGYSDPADPTRIKAVKSIVGSQSLAAFVGTLEYLLDPPPDGVAKR